MTNILINALCGVCSIIAPLYFLALKAWQLFSIRILKRYLGIETSTYRKWHDRRARRIQRELDREHVEAEQPYYEFYQTI